MEPDVKQALVDFERITPAGEHWFYGYYDNPAFSLDDSRHLAHRVLFRERLQRPEDVAQVAVVDIAEGETHVVAETKAWNFQQGSMLQWVGGHPDRIFFNTATPTGEYRGTLLDLGSGDRRDLPMPLANLARDGSRGIAINFDRVFDFRPGYGYCQKRDPWFDRPHAVDDGVWLVDLADGALRQVLSMQRIWEAMAHAFDGADAKICINHITFNPAGDRFVLLARNFPSGEVKRWITTVFVSDLRGNLSVPLYDATIASHYWWSDDTTLVFYAEGPDGLELYRVDVDSGDQAVIDPEFFGADGHCSTSPDGAWLLYDSYPRDGYRSLYLYDLRSRKGVTLGVLRDLPGAVNDVRCDLHPRWNRAGTGISFDGTFEGYRGIYVADLSGVMTSGF